MDIQEKLYTRLILFTRLYKDARSTKPKMTHSAFPLGLNPCFYYLARICIHATKLFIGVLSRLAFKRPLQPLEWWDHSFESR